MKRLVIRPGAIGDFIVSIPAIECLREAEFEIWCSGAVVPLAARIADRARSIASTGLDLLELTGPNNRLLETLGGFDSIVSWYGANRPEFRQAAAALHLPVQFFPALPAAGTGLHATDFYLDQIRAIAACAPGAVPRIPCGVSREDFAVIHPFAGSQKKRWPLENFQELARRLQTTMPVEWCAGPGDDLPGARRFSDLYELARWLASARIYIGNDSGPTHLAAAAGTPVIALFSASDPAAWAPRGPRVTVLSTPRWDDLTVPLVAEAVTRALSVV